MSRIARLAAAIALAVAVGGCQDKPQRAACPTDQVCLTFGNLTDPGTLDPQATTLTSEFAIVGDLVIGLTTDGPDAKATPGMATSWETSPDGLIWTFHLRPALWSDGKPVTADDFVYSYRRLLNPKTGSSYAYLAYVLKNGQALSAGKAAPEALGARALGPHTLQLRLEHPAPYLPELLKHASFYPVPPHVVERYGDAWTEPGRYVGNGPYRLVSWRLGDRLRIEKNPHFWDADKVCIDRVDFFQTPDAVSSERRVKSGELDLNTTFQSNRIGLLRGKSGMGAYVRATTNIGLTYLAFNTADVPALRDRRVRRALSEAIDRDFITLKLWRAGQQPAYAFVPPGVANFERGARTGWAGLSFAARQADAKRLLAEAGYGPGRPLKLELKSSNQPDNLLLAEALQADWRAIGVESQLAQSESQVQWSDLTARNFQVGVTGWVADFNDATSFLTLMKSDTGAQNFSDYKNPRFDALLAAADAEVDAARRASLLRQAEQVMLDDDVVAPISYRASRNLVSPKVTGWVDNPQDFHRIRWLCKRS